MATIVVAALLAAAVVALFLRVNANEVVVAPATPPPAVTTPPTSAPTPTAAPTTAPPTATPTAIPTATATPTTTAAPVDGDVASYQQVLADLGYYVGALDGEAGPATRSAIVAFQKVHGLAADGEVGPQTLAALAAPQQPSLRGGAATRVEIDLTRQVLYLVEGGALTRIVPVSSGSGESYTTASGGSARSLTPVGSFTVERKIQGVREAPLGTLYDPMYFHRGWAIHGSNSVPSHPASHGCVRVTRADAQWLFDRAPVGMPVQLYGGDHVFSPAEGETAGTDTPAGDTPDTIVPDAISTDEPTAEPTAPPSPTPTPSPAPAPPPAPAPTAAPTTPPPAPAPTSPPPAPPPAPAPSPRPTGTTPPPPDPTGTERGAGGVV